MPAEDPADPRPLEVLAVLRLGLVPVVVSALAVAGLVAERALHAKGGMGWSDVVLALAVVAGGPIVLRRRRLLEVSTWDVRFAQVGTFGSATIPWPDVASVTVTRRTIVVRTRFGTARRMPLWLGGQTTPEVLGALLAEAAVHGFPVHFGSPPADPAE